MGHPSVIADRLRAAAEFRRCGDLFYCMQQITFARSNRLHGMDSALLSDPVDMPRHVALAQSLWRRHCIAAGHIV